MTERRECIFSPCRRYRYKLDIIWNPEVPPQVFIGLNPSTADENVNDPTVRRCIDYAKRWGAGGLRMLNAYSYRSTDPTVLKGLLDPWGMLDYGLEIYCLDTYRNPIAAWGKHVNDIGWDYQAGMLSEDFKAIRLDCLSINKDGTPGHPLYLRKALTPIPFNY